MQELAKEFIEFVAKSPTAFHAADMAAQALDAAGYERLNEYDMWTLKLGGRYYVTRNLSTVLAFQLPDGRPNHFQIVASHSDSPMFKLKPRAEEKALDHYVKLNVEKYGGMIMSSWFDRPLSIAGRVIIRTPDGARTQLVDLNRDAAIIPNMPIHFNRDINDGYKYNAQSDMMPIYGGADADLMAEIAALCGVEQEEIIGSDLFLYDRMAGTVWGADGEYVSCPRLDDMECGWTSLKAFLAAKSDAHVNLYALFDNEEVGSTTKQGANSTFLNDVLTRICGACGLSDEAARAAIAASFMVSADNAHAVHPNHADKYDADNRTFMNDGIVIKHNAAQHYTTDAVSCAAFASVCEKAGVPVQHFANRSDVPGGGTLGNIANTHASMNTVDIGLAQLAMHSSYETAGVRDIEYMIKGLTEFYNADIRFMSDGVINM